MSALSRYPENDGDDNDGVGFGVGDENGKSDKGSIMSMSGTWSEMLQTIFSGVVTDKGVNVENSKEDADEKISTTPYETQLNHGRSPWYRSIFSSFSIKQRHDGFVANLHEQSVHTKNLMNPEHHHDDETAAVKKRRNRFSKLWRKFRKVER